MFRRNDDQVMQTRRPAGRNHLGLGNKEGLSEYCAVYREVSNQAKGGSVDIPRGKDVFLGVQPSMRIVIVEGKHIRGKTMAT